MSRGAQVCWAEEYIRTGKRERIEVERVDDEAGIVFNLGRATSIDAARKYIRGAGPGHFRIVRVTHEAVETTQNEEER